jgi:1-acyl-sn-glycerol-3-phosphate acyltransferase
MPQPGRAESSAYNLIYWAAFYGFTFGWRLRATGRENLPATGPALLVANHQSFVDPFVIGVSARRRIGYLARSNLWVNRPVGWLLDTFWAVPIDRGYGREGLASVFAELDKGRPVLMFPEGERTHTGALQPLKAGVSLLVRRVTCPIVPVGVAGAYQAWSRHRKLPTPDPLPLPPDGRSIAVAFGRPIDPARFKGVDRDRLLTELQDAIRATVGRAERLRR